MAQRLKEGLFSSKIREQYLPGIATKQIAGHKKWILSQYKITYSKRLKPKQQNGTAEVPCT